MALVVTTEKYPNSWIVDHLPFYFFCGSVMSFKGKQTIDFKQPIVQSRDWNAY